MWLPLARPATNPRLDDLGGSVEPPLEATLIRSVVLARRAADPSRGVVLADGLGAWRDDRQLEPVTGEPSAAPLALTDGHTYHPTRRLGVLSALLRQAAGVAPIALTMTPIVLTPGAASVDVSRADAALRVTWRDLQADSIELLVHAEPFVLRATDHRRYQRSQPPLAVDLVFENGERLLDDHPAGEAGTVDMALGSHVGRRVEEITLIVSGATEGMVEVNSVRIGR